MAPAVYVMPLRTWLTKSYRTTWGPGEQTESPSGRRRSPEDADRLQEQFLSRLEPLLGRRPEWDEDSAHRSATAYSGESLSRPFLQARQWSYKLKLPQLAALDMPQIWLPAEFYSVFHFPSPWNEEEDVWVASLPRLRAELELLHGGLLGEGGEELADRRQVESATRSLLAQAGLGLDHRLPVIVEG